MQPPPTSSTGDPLILLEVGEKHGYDCTPLRERDRERDMVSQPEVTAEPDEGGLEHIAAC